MTGGVMRRPDKGAPGREVELSTGGGFVRWRYAGDDAWNNLVTLASLAGASGREIELSANSTHIRWRYVGDVSWANLTALVDLKGADGARGSLWTSGSGVPVAAANVGDMYLNTANSDVYQRGSLGWQLAGNIRGATGPAGPNFSITEVTGATSSTINNRYIANHATVRVVITLPTTAAIGDFIQVFGKGVAGWRVAQNASQQIRGATNSTVGTGGYIQSGSQNDTVTLVCTTANTMWNVQNQRGSPSIA